MSVGRILGVVQKRIFGKEIFPCGPTVEKFCFTNTKTKRNTFSTEKIIAKYQNTKPRGSNYQFNMLNESYEKYRHVLAPALKQGYARLALIT